MFVAKNGLLKLIFWNDFFFMWKLTLKVWFWHFLRSWRYVNLQNLAISFEYSWFFLSKNPSSKKLHNVTDINLCSYLQIAQSLAKSINLVIFVSFLLVIGTQTKRKLQALNSTTEVSPMKKEAWELGSLDLKVTTSSLAYLISKWFSSKSCIFQIRSDRNWSKYW